MTPLLWALTVALASGVWLVVQHVPTAAPPPLRSRVAPYVGRPGVVWTRGAAVATAVSWLPTWVARSMRRAARPIDWLSGGSGSAGRRLDSLGGTLTLEQLRLEQLIWGLGAAGAASLLVVAKGPSGTDWLMGGVVVAVAGVSGVLLRDRALTTAVHRRGERLRSELPTVIELLAMAVSAGSGLLAALERASHVGSGVAASELTRVLDDVRVGLPLIPALARMAGRTEVPEMQRFVDALIAAVDRGTPLADVLVAQAMDARESGRRALIEAGGRKEIAMMVPVVFLVLPVSVMFVLFPGFYGLSLGS